VRDLLDGQGAFILCRPSGSRWTQIGSRSELGADEKHDMPGSSIESRLIKNAIENSDTIHEATLYSMAPCFEREMNSVSHR
jgi:hypothetical protein